MLFYVGLSDMCRGRCCTATAARLIGWLFYERGVLINFSYGEMDSYIP